MYGSMHLLDISQPVDIDDLYVDVNILEKLTNQQWLSVEDLIEDFNSNLERVNEEVPNRELRESQVESFDTEISSLFSEVNRENYGTTDSLRDAIGQKINQRWDKFNRLGIGRVQRKRVPGLEAIETYSRLLVLGKPGAGKTTFLKYLTIQCIKARTQSHLIPVFISLKNFSEDIIDINEDLTFEHYIHSEFSSCGISDWLITESILNEGRALVLLDGLDEVPEELERKITRKIRRFIQTYYQNELIITCRIAASKHRFVEEGFTAVEIADFSEKQIESFAKKWFVAFNRDYRIRGLSKARQFIEKLNLPENHQIRELAVTPILLNLTCLVFQENADFPSNRSRLYEEGLDILLVKWDEARGIYRRNIYRDLPTENKIEMLAYIASKTFEKSDYFFKKESVQEYISFYINNLCQVVSQSSYVDFNSEEILKAIEVQHGLLVERARTVYSFSHLTFQEYFTAKYFTIHPDSGILKTFVSHCIESRWREVFLLALGIATNVELLVKIFKEQIDELLLKDVKLQLLLIWIHQKSLDSISPKVKYTTTKLRLFYFAFYFDNCSYDFSPLLSEDAGFELEFNLQEEIFVSVDSDPFSEDLEDGILDSENEDDILDLDLACESELDLICGQLCRYLAQHTFSEDELKEWWKMNIQSWNLRMHNLSIKYPNLPLNWRLSDDQISLLQQYSVANKLLLECLEHENKISSTARIVIEETLFYPIGEVFLREEEGKPTIIGPDADMDNSPG